MTSFLRFYTKTNPPRQAVRYTSLDWRRNQPKFVPAQTIKPIYLQSLEYLLPRAGVSAIGATLREGQLVSKLSEMPYSPAMIDGRYGYPALNRDWLNSNTTRRRRQRPRPNFKDTQVGRDSLGPNLTSTAVVGQISVRALDRNIRQYQASATPFLLSVHFNAPVSSETAIGSWIKARNSLCRGFLHSHSTALRGFLLLRVNSFSFWPTPAPPRDWMWYLLRLLLPKPLQSGRSREPP